MKGNAPKQYTGPTYPVGTRCLILRPNLWSNYSGVVKSVENGIHLLAIPITKPTVYNKIWHANVTGTELLEEL